jgi:hypothetical protein
MSSRDSLASAIVMLGLSLAAAGAQQRPLPVPNAGVRIQTPQPILENTSDGAGTGPFAVTVTSNNGTSPVYLGTASGVTFTTNTGPSAIPTQNYPGTVVVFFAPNNSLFLGLLNQSCFLQLNRSCSNVTLTIQQWGTGTITTTNLYGTIAGFAGPGVGVFTYLIAQSATQANVVVR